jgi:CubicO group peptidase (beta-lactamase class C family)
MLPFYYHMPFRTHSFIAAFILFIALLPAGGTLRAQNSQNAEKAKQINALVDAMVAAYQFNGAVLVTENQHVVVNRAVGIADFRTQDAIKTNTVFNLGEASRQFTAVAVVMLKELGKLKYEDEINRYLPELPYSGITIRHLLSHTSGLPDYHTLFAIHWDDKTKTASNRDLLTLLKAKRPALAFRPGERLQHSATNYALLAALVERVTSQPFDQFVKQYLFDPIGMKNSVVYSRLRSPSVPSRAYGFKAFLLKPPALDEMNYLEGIMGDENVYSCTDDLLQWDYALYSDRLVRQSVLAEAFAPTQLNNGSTIDFGFGWNISQVDRRKVVDQDGTTGGFHAVFERMLDDKSALVILSNTQSPYLFELKDAIYAIMRGKPYTLPSPSVAPMMGKTLKELGTQAALNLYNKAKDENPRRYAFRESELNALGIELLELKRPKDAIEVLKLNAEMFPYSFNVYDSLGEAYYADGNTEQALANYKRSLEIYPDNTNAQAMIKQLSGGK